VVIGVVAATLVAGTLAGCRSEPGVAAYVGGVRITEDRVTAVLDDARTRLDAAIRSQAEAQASQAGQPAPSTMPAVELPISRQDVVNALVGLEVVKMAAQRQGVAPVDVPVDQLVNYIRLPAETQFFQAYHEYSGYRSALEAKATPAQPTEEDLRDVFRRFLAAGGAGPETSFDMFRQQYIQGQNLQLVQAAVTLREMLAPVTAEADVSVNPRYRAELSLLDFADQQGGRHPLVVLPLTGAPRSPAVLDAA
jgi:hypothetical protein